MLQQCIASPSCLSQVDTDPKILIVLACILVLILIILLAMCYTYRSIKRNMRQAAVRKKNMAVTRKFDAPEVIALPMVRSEFSPSIDQ